MVHHILIVTLLSLCTTTALPNPSRILVARAFSKQDQTEHQANNPQQKIGLIERITTWWQSEDGDTFLHVAARFNNIADIKIALESGIEPNILNRNGKSALYIAAEKGHTEAVIALLADERTNPNLGFKNTDKTTQIHRSVSPLWIAVQKQYSNIIKILLNASQIEPDNGKKVILLRSSHHSKIFSTIDIFAPTTILESPLKAAQRIGNKEIIELFAS